MNRRGFLAAIAGLCAVKPLVSALPPLQATLHLDDSKFKAATASVASADWIDIGAIVNVSVSVERVDVTCVGGVFREYLSGTKSLVLVLNDAAACGQVASKLNGSVKLRGRLEDAEVCVEGRLLEIEFQHTFNRVYLYLVPSRFEVLLH